MCVSGSNETQRASGTRARRMRVLVRDVCICTVVCTGLVGGAREEPECPEEIGRGHGGNKKKVKAVAQSTTAAPVPEPDVQPRVDPKDLEPGLWRPTSESHPFSAPAKVRGLHTT